MEPDPEQDEPKESNPIWKGLEQFKDLKDKGKK